MTGSRYRISVGIPTFDRNQVLVETIARLIDVIDPATTEIIVADQTPLHDESTTAQLKQWACEGRIRWLTCQPPSLTAARNRILCEARSNIVLFVDDDVIVPPDIIARHLEQYDNDATVAAVAGEAFHCHDPNHPPGLEDPWSRATPHFLTRCKPGPLNEMVGAHHSVRRDVALGIGGYDEAFIGPANGEDSDMALRLTLAGHRVEYDPRAWLIHLRSPSGGCRIPGTTTHAEWTKSANFLLFSFRHWRNHWAGRRALLWAMRAGPLRKQNLRNPLLWPSAWWNWFQAMGYALRHHRFHAPQDRNPTSAASAQAPQNGRS
jgi:GT2 family glycosyltransferase